MTDKKHKKQLGLFDRPVGVPASPRIEAAKRDAALGSLEDTRARLINRASLVAEGIALRQGTVTSVEVFVQLRASGYGDMIDSCDPRWMGAVFRAGRGWRRVGWRSEGSHGRPVAVWARA